MVAIQWNLFIKDTPNKGWTGRISEKRPTLSLIFTHIGDKPCWEYPVEASVEATLRVFTKAWPLHEGQFAIMARTVFRSPQAGLDRPFLLKVFITCTYPRINV